MSQCQSCVGAVVVSAVSWTHRMVSGRSVPGGGPRIGTLPSGPPWTAVRRKRYVVFFIFVFFLFSLCFSFLFSRNELFPCLPALPFSVFPRTDVILNFASITWHIRAPFLFFRPNNNNLFALHCALFFLHKSIDGLKQ